MLALLPSFLSFLSRYADGCDICPDGTSSEFGASVCTECAVGMFSTKGNPFEILRGFSYTDFLKLEAACDDCGGGGESSSTWFATGDEATSFVGAAKALNHLDDQFVQELMGPLYAYFPTDLERLDAAGNCTLCGDCTLVWDPVDAVETDGVLGGNCAQLGYCTIDTFAACNDSVSALRVADEPHVEFSDGAVPGCSRIGDESFFNPSQTALDNDVEAGNDEGVICARSLCTDLRQVFCDAHQTLLDLRAKVTDAAASGAGIGCSGSYGGSNSNATIANCSCLVNNFTGSCDAFPVLYELEGLGCAQVSPSFDHALGVAKCVIVSQTVQCSTNSHVCSHWCA